MFVMLCVLNDTADQVNQASRNIQRHLHRLQEGRVRLCRQAIALSADRKLKAKSVARPDSCDWTCCNSILGGASAQPLLSL